MDVRACFEYSGFLALNIKQMIKKNEVKENILTPHEYDIINEGDYLVWSDKPNEGIMYESFDSKEEFKKAFYKYNKDKTAVDAVFHLVWSSDFIHFNEDVTGDYIYIKEPIH